MRMHASGGKTLEQCKRICMENSECGVIEFLQQTGWCYIWKHYQSCTEYTQATGEWSIYRFSKHFLTS